MKSTRSPRYWYQVHKWNSLVSTLFLLVMCATGLPLIFSDEIESALQDPPAATAVPGTAARTDIDGMVEIARSRHDRDIVRFVFIDADDAQVTVVMAPADSPDRSRDHRIVFDARTAAVVEDTPSAAQQPATFMGTVLRLHTELLAGFAGEMLLAAIGVLFVVAVVSGLALYGPSMKKLEFGTVRSRSARVRQLDLHNLLGISVLAWMLVVGATGILNELSKPLSAVWRRSEMSALLVAYRGTAGVADAAAPSPAQAAFDTVGKALPDRNVTSIIFPSTSFSNPHHYLIWTNGNTSLTSRLFTAALVDAKTGELTAIAPMPFYLRVLQVSRPLHFGDYGGPGLKIVWALLDLITMIVLVGGLYLWWGRRPGKTMP